MLGSWTGASKLHDFWFVNNFYYVDHGQCFGFSIWNVMEDPRTIVNQAKVKISQAHWGKKKQHRFEKGAATDSIA